MRRYCFTLLLLLLPLISAPSFSAENSIAAGTTIKVRMAESIDSRVRKAGYRFKVTVDSDISNTGRVVIKSGSQAQAIVNQIGRSGKGQKAPEIIVTLTMLRINNRQINIETFPIAGKGTTKERKAVGVIDENENIVVGKQGEAISASIPLQTKGYDLILTEATILYFILKEPIAL